MADHIRIVGERLQLTRTDPARLLLNGEEITNSSSYPVTKIAASGAAVTIDASSAQLFDITLTANCTVNVTSSTAGTSKGITAYVLFTQGSGGPFDVTWSANVQQAEYYTSLSTAYGGTDCFMLFSKDGGEIFLIGYA